MTIGRDGIAGLILFAISLALLYQSFQLPSLPIVPIGPGFYPGIVLTFLAGASALLVLQDLMRRRAAVTADEKAQRWNWWPVAKAFAIVGAYIALMPLIGFRLSTVLFVASLQAALDPPRDVRGWAILAAVAIGTAAAGYLVFERYLLVLLPRGAWTGF